MAIIPFNTLDEAHGNASLTLPAINYNVRVERLEEALTQDTNKLMFKLTTTITEPAEFAGLRLYDNFVMGSEDDPNADNAETWKSVTGKRFHRFVKKTEVPYEASESTDVFFARAIGAELTVGTVQKIDTGNNPKYAGRTQTKISQYFRLGERPVGATVDTPVANPFNGTAAKPKGEAEVTCTSCRKRVPRSQMQRHLADEHGVDVELKTASV